MCEPTTLAVIAVGAIVAGGAVAAKGQAEAAAADKSASQFSAAVLRNNQIIADRQAEDARARGAVAATEKAKETKQLIGRQRVALAAGGGVIDEGSALDLTADTAGIGELDRLTILNNAEREALGFTTQGLNFQSEALLTDAGAKARQRAARLAIAGTLIGTAGSAASVGAKFRTPATSPAGSGPALGAFGARN